MNSESFAYWLQGFVELNGGQIPTEDQWRSIVEHLNLVFKKVTPPLFGSQDQKYCNFNQGEFQWETAVGKIPVGKFPALTDQSGHDTRVNLNDITISC